MRRVQRLALALAVSLSLLLVVSAQGEPADVSVVIYPGDSQQLTLGVTPPGPPPLDIVLVQDETVSYKFPIGKLQDLAPTLVAALDAWGPDYATAVVGFRDFARYPWGYAPIPGFFTGDWVYRRLSDLSPGGDGLLAGVDLLDGGRGGDGAEAQLEALHYLADPDHPAIDGDCNGSTDDPEDTPTGQQPTWRGYAEKVVLLATDAWCHVNSDTDRYGNHWPGDEGTESPAVTAGILAEAGITVIGLTPNGAGTIPCVDALAAATGGSVQATGPGGDTVVEAVMAGLQELVPPTDVWWEASCDAGISVSLAPEAYYGVPSNAPADFDASIVVANPTDPGGYSCHVTFYAGQHPDHGEVAGQQTIHVEVIPIPVEIDIKPQSLPTPTDPDAKRQVPVVIMGREGVGIETLNLTTLAFGPGGALPTHDLTDVAVYESHLQDANGDAYIDLMCHFRVGETGLTVDDTEACVTGDLIDERAFEGCDSVEVKDKK